MPANPHGRYAPVLGASAHVDELFVRLRNTLEAEMRLQTELAQLLGAMDVLLAGAAHGGAAGAGSTTAPPPRKVPRLTAGAGAAASAAAADAAAARGAAAAEATR